MTNGEVAATIVDDPYFIGWNAFLQVWSGAHPTSRPSDQAPFGYVAEALNWRRDRLAIQYALLKAVALPFALFWILRCFMDTEQAFLLAILFGSPAPLTGVVWCKEYGGDAELAVDCTICSTLMFLVVMSAVLLLGKTLGLVA